MEPDRFSDRLSALSSEGAESVESGLQRLVSKASAGGAGSLRVVSLNLGGRNTNPMEFELKGDGSKVATEATSVLRRAKTALRCVKDGPLAMLPAEVELMEEIIAAIYSEPTSGSCEYIRSLLRCETWELVLKNVRAHHQHLFNALNLSTLKLKRPSVWEDPASCAELTSRLDFLHAWKEWYCQLDRTSKFWLEDAPRMASKRGMDTATGFAGLLVFDAMCLCTAGGAMAAAAADQHHAEEGPTDAAAGPGRGAIRIPFRELADFAAQLPASNLAARHEVAKSYIAGVQALFAQEARDFAMHPDIMEEFLPPFCAQDEFTAVFLRKDAFKQAVDIRDAVISKMGALMDAQQQTECAWSTTSKRLAAICCQCQAQMMGLTICMVSLHCARSGHTAALVETLRKALADFSADLHIVGMDSNCSPQDALAFQEQLRSSGFELGCVPKQNQVTVAKQRTCFHTQVQKIGVNDISHKDYIVSWGSARFQRKRTRYTPDLRTAYGVEQETKKCVRLPTTRWPFDHCGVETSFDLFSKWRERRLMRWATRSCALAGLPLFIILLPLASTERNSPYGEPGTWHHESWVGTPRVGICEASSPCVGDWVQGESSCYIATPRMGYWEAEEYCRRGHAGMVSIGSEAENRFVTGAICPEGEFCWIGLRSDIRGERHWWTSGEPVDYSRLVGLKVPFPLFPLSTAEEYQAAVLSNLPGKISGCRNDFAVPLLQGTRFFILLNWFGPTAVLIVTVVILLLPRRPQALTTAYLLIALAVNFPAALLKTGDHCFASDILTHRLAYTLYTWVDTGGHTVLSLVAFGMIIQRLRVLGPVRALSALFHAMAGMCTLLFLSAVLFIDPSRTLNAKSELVLLYCAQLGVVVLIFVTACFLVARDLYRVWACLQQEATTGRSSQHGSDLTQEVRAARLHFFSVTAALTTTAIRGFTVLSVIYHCTKTNISDNWWPVSSWHLATILDSITNDVCAYVLSVMNMDGAVVRASGITKEVYERACQEVEQHYVAVRVLKAAGTSAEQLRQLALLESNARAASQTEQSFRLFATFQSAVWVETARIHWLMQCVRLRAMTMPMRYRYLIEVPIYEGLPRQHVPAHLIADAESPCEADDYFTWLYSEADGARQVFFQQVQQLLEKFNSAPWPRDLGLPCEQFPWMTWANNFEGLSRRQLQKGEVVNPGDILIHSPTKSLGSFLLGRDGSTSCFVLEEASSSKVKIHRSGMESAEQVSREQLRVCGGGGVFVPGPKKSRQRCRDKIASDYAGKVPHPAAASLTDICRCMIVLDDPYAAAVLVAHLRNNMKVVRVKNRFAEDVLEETSPEELLTMFYSSADSPNPKSDASFGTSPKPDGKAEHSGTHSMYRDISMNVEVATQNGVPFICEIQVTLANLAILKSADQRLYTARRMKSPQELLATRVFTGDAKEEGEANLAAV